MRIFIYFLTILCGVAIGLALSEIGLRLVFYENEANRNYWGRGAFVSAEEVPYRHAPNATAYVGRYNSFGPYPVRFNKYGYRDDREEPSREGSFRILVAGASYMIGLSIENDEYLFHNQLERILRNDPDWPDDVEVYSIAQTGYLLRETCTLLQQELDRYQPHLVILSAPLIDTGEETRKPVDIVNGYRLPSDRWLRGTFLDTLRTRSYVYMRTSGNRLFRWPPRIPAPEPVKPLARELERWLGGISSRQRDIDPAYFALLKVKELLDEKGIPLLVVFPGQNQWYFTERVQHRGIRTLNFDENQTWTAKGDRHWNPWGHLGAAEQVAEVLTQMRMESDRK